MRYPYIPQRELFPLKESNSNLKIKISYSWSNLKLKSNSSWYPISDVRFLLLRYFFAFAHLCLETCYLPLLVYASLHQRSLLVLVGPRVLHHPHTHSPHNCLVVPKNCEEPLYIQLSTLSLLHLLHICFKTL